MEADAAGYPEPPRWGSEAETLVGSLERQRATFGWKCADLDAVGLRRTVGASTLTLGGLLKHLAFMEDLNFTRDLAGAPLPEVWTTPPIHGDADQVWASAANDSPDTLSTLWTTAVARSRAAVSAALVGDGLDATVRAPSGTSCSLRRRLVDMVEEYARHTGQADLLREAVDGRVGEDPPGPVHPYRLASG